MDENTIPDGDVSDDALVAQLLAKGEEGTDDGIPDPEDAPDESGSEDEDEEQRPEPRRLKVKVDGEEREVTEDELVKSYQIESSAQKRLREAAEVRKAVEAERQQVTALAQQHLQALNYYQQQLTEPEIDWDALYKSDPLAYTHERAKQMERAQKREAAARHKYQIAQQQAHDESLRHAAYLAEQAQELEKKLPEFKDESTRKAAQARIWEYARSIGYTDDDLSAAGDHRGILALEKARRYDELMRKAESAKAGKPASPVARPSSPTPPASKAAKAREALKKTGSDADALAYLLSKG